MTEKEKQFNQWFDEYADGVKVFEEADMKQVYLQGRAELEETNNELEGKLVLSDMVLADKTKRIKELENKLMDKVCLESLDIVSGKIKQLEKENAELKAFKKKCKFNVSDICKDIETENQLTKAKEIIKQFLSYEQIPRDCLRERYRKLLEEAEQFLKEIEK